MDTLSKFSPLIARLFIGGFFLLGLVFLSLLPETHGRDLPE